MPKSFILCIDDEELGLRIRSVVLEHAGYAVATATSGPDGIAIFKRDPVDLVVLDYFMPEMHGGDVAAALRRLRPEVPIIMLSANVNLPEEVRRMVDCAILKGDGPEALLAKIREFLSIRSDGIRREGDVG